LITFNGNGVPKRTRFGIISKVCSLALATENIVLNTLQNKTGAVPTGIPFRGIIWLHQYRQVKLSSSHYSDSLP
ncbi:hypothetical protein F8Z48_18200, partial [Shigella flexneri]|nr:hypothetical protein [Shigella flexneri]